VAQSEEYKSLTTALNDLNTFSQSFQKKINTSEYWQNKDQAKTDLDQFKSRLNQALDKAESFNSSKLDLKTSFT
jgi:hypothetical protein